jgi:hypothetical protein
MTAAEFNNTAEGSRLHEKIVDHYREIEMMKSVAVRYIDDRPDRTYLDWDDGGFFENPEV